MNYACDELTMKLPGTNDILFIEAIESVYDAKAGLSVNMADIRQFLINVKCDLGKHEIIQIKTSKDNRIQINPSHGVSLKHSQYRHMNFTGIYRAQKIEMTSWKMFNKNDKSNN